MPNTYTSSGSEVSATVPTVGGQDIASLLRIQIGDTDSSNYEYSNANLTLMMANAVQVYNGFSPYHLEATLTTVADQRDYAAPSNATKIVSVDWRTFPSLTSESWVAFWGIYGGLPRVCTYRNWQDGALNRIQQELFLRLDAAGQGNSEQIEYRTSYSAIPHVRLYPTPAESGISVYITYSVPHPLQANDYFTIPASHAQYILDLMEAQVLDTRSNAIGSTAEGIRVGTTDFRFGNSSGSIRKRSEGLRQGVRDALTGTIGMVG